MWQLLHASGFLASIIEKECLVWHESHFDPAVVATPGVFGPQFVVFPEDPILWQ